MKSELVLIKPVLTEKASNHVKSNVYTFEVATGSNKFQIAQTIEEMYKVKVDSIRVNIRPGKTRKAGRRQQLKQLPDIKIAYVKLSEGKIDLFPQA